MLRVALVLICTGSLCAAEPPKKVDLPPDFDTADLEFLIRWCPKPVERKKDDKTGFVVGGTNKTELIRKLTELNGRSIPDLEADMRPGAVWAKELLKKGMDGSKEGFLGKEEKLLDVLAADNDTVVTKLGLTHQKIADEMNLIAAIGLWRASRENKESVQFVYRGRRFKTEAFHTRGYQYSPFLDGTRSGSGIEVENVETGKKVGYGLLVPYMIERYGFYEGNGTTYRVDPEKVVEVLDFLKPAKK